MASGAQSGGILAQPVTLDGCCNEGGGARGLVQAGHYVVGVDKDPKCRDGYLRSGAHEFIAADILDVLADRGFMSRFDSAAVHPPCQFYSWMSHCRPDLAAKYPELISKVQPLLDAWGRPYLIENVEGARAWLRDPVTMCMFMFGRPGYRHRLLEAGGGLKLVPPLPPEDLHPDVRRDKVCGWPHPVAAAKAGHWEPGKFVSVAGHERKEAVFSVMEIELWDRRTRTGWMSNRNRIKEAIPPYLGKWIAEQFDAALGCWPGSPPGYPPFACLPEAVWDDGPCRVRHVRPGGLSLCGLLELLSPKRLLGGIMRIRRALVSAALALGALGALGASAAPAIAGTAAVSAHAVPHGTFHYE